MNQATNDLIEVFNSKEEMIRWLIDEIEKLDKLIYRMHTGAKVSRGNYIKTISTRPLKNKRCVLYNRLCELLYEE